MASTSCPQIIDDDDGFDWEAAVQAIDVACTKNDNRPPISSKQSTLDKFIGVPKIGVPKPQKKQNHLNNNSVGVDDERVSCIKIDPEAAKTWVYPVAEKVPRREYQFEITHTSLFSNTLVALPTGLGKTFIAAVVMYNYFRWFPEGKIVFAAPSRPLVMQQIEACHNIVGIPQEWTIDMTGQTSPSKRASFWKTKRVFFVTPQVLERDIQSGSCLVKHIVCLVIDEAHRASGNYSYCVVVRELLAADVQFRILALTATPGSKQLTIQQIIDNLQISTLEYRNESDSDVLRYVHDRKIELIKVAMGQDADAINNLLSEVIRPFVTRLGELGVLPKRDFHTLSPCDLLNSRDRFRQAPPENLPHKNYGEIEGKFGALITLYHIRKLLSGHGIRPACEMLEEKLKQGHFHRLMQNNEVINKANILMQKSLSRGEPSPKLSKMLDILIDHFKTTDPQKSRVIIFSNFRGSVRDIMDALKNIPEFVKATQFIGQSSGKASKGQSQKAQQAVLEKFRSGDYNVIVATSIGEEGLDIMEVGLVICFDANVSPLRMIQRMGRTGRKHEGRVVVLACEGSELKGYTRKQANCKTINKHMRNGGVNSFNFHSSPRMIPHIFKPEVHYAELSIEQFVPRGKKVLEDHVVQTPEFKMELTSAEHDLLKKYYHSTPEKLWRPSLIAFPHFQAIPSRVHTIKHSLRSLMLIDTMQYLQGLKYSRDNNLFIEDDAASDLCLSFDNARPRGRDMEDLQTFHDSLEVNSERKALESHVDPSQTEEMHFPPEFRKKKSSVHSYLFGSDFVSVDPLGRVLVMSLPVLPLKKNPHSKFTNAGAFDFKASLSEYKEEIMQVKCDNDFGTRCDGNENMRVNCESPRVVETKTTMVLDCNDSCNDFRDVELSPRLTNLLMSGIVPESPTDDTVISEGKRKGEFVVQDLDSHSELQTELFLKSSVLEKNDNIIKENSANERDVQASSINDEIQISTDNRINNSTRPYSTLAVVEEVGTPPENPSPNSCSKDWHIDSGGSKSESIRQECKFKRLRKYGDIPKMPSKEKVEYRGSTAELARSHKHGGGGKKIIKDVRAFIDTQAEVSGGTPVSEDDEDEQDNNSYDDSFIDDRINPTGASTQAESSRRDMMAIYRRSLLSQSPMERLPNSFTDYSPDSVGPTTRINESVSSAGTTRHSLKSLRTPYTGLESGSTGLNSACSQLNPEKSNVTQRENVENTGSRKRKLSFYQNGSLPIHNLEQEFLLQCEAAKGGDINVHGHIEKDIPMRNEFDDDDLFFEGIDLDAVEEQATNYLKHKSELSGQNQMRIPHPETGDAMDSPTFDLGF